MQIPRDAMLLRVFIGESDRHDRQPLHEAIGLRAREFHLAGATVVPGSIVFGKSNRLHTAKILRLSMDLPLVIEIVDSEQNANKVHKVPGSPFSGLQYGVRFIALALTTA